MCLGDVMKAIGTRYISQIIIPRRVLICILTCQDSFCTAWSFGGLENRGYEGRIPVRSEEENWKTNI